MQELIELLQKNNITFKEIIPLPASGGDRIYYEIILNDDTKIIGTSSFQLEENDAFFAFQKVFARHKVPVPKIIAQTENGIHYLQTHVGDKTLLDVLLKEGATPEVFILYKESLRKLANLQIKAGAEIDYSLCLVSQQFDADAALRDLNYCVQYYLQPLGISFDQEAAKGEFSLFAKEIGAIQPIHFMYRDFQGRNIMINEQDQPIFIDFQGGMRGPLQYDLASLLWQAKAALPNDWKEDLLLYYYNTANAILGGTLDKNLFYQQYYFIVLMRLLQVLGAYGRRGLEENKQHFLDSIPFAITNLETWLRYATIEEKYPAMHYMIQEIIVQKEIYKK
jgi:aminoglycoside/choline kinase family phosphotransferase